MRDLKETSVFKVSRYLHYSLDDFQGEVCGMGCQKLTEAKFLLTHPTRRNNITVRKWRIADYHWPSGTLRITTQGVSRWLDVKTYGKVWVVLRN